MAGVGAARGRVRGVRCSTKRAGDIAETAFLARATEEGLVVASPYGGGLRYDTIVDNARTRLLVQVKSTSQLCRKNVYQVRLARQEYQRNGRAAKAVGYLRAEVDFFAVYVAPEKSWYILPWSALKGRTVLTLNGKEHAKPGPCGEYREAWDLLRK